MGRDAWDAEPAPAWQVLVFVAVVVGAGLVLAPLSLVGRLRCRMAAVVDVADRAL